MSGIMGHLTNSGRETRLDQQQFSGVVVDNNDPLKNQRVRVRIADIHKGIPDNLLPWSQKGDGGVSAGGGVGTVDVPPIGARVSVKFLDNQGYNPEYSGAVSTDNIGSENALPNYPHSYGRVDHAGNSIYVDTSTNTIFIGHASGTVITIHPSGKVEVTSANDILLQAQGNIDMRSAGNILLQAAGILHLRGGAIKTNKKLPGDPNLPTDSGSPQAPSATTSVPRPVIPFTPNDIDR